MFCVFSLHSGLCFRDLEAESPYFFPPFHSTSMLSACTRCLYPAIREVFTLVQAANAGLFLSCSNKNIYSVVRSVGDVEGPLGSMSYCVDSIGVTAEFSPLRKSL